jgi:hypothetical protein
MKIIAIEEFEGYDQEMFLTFLDSDDNSYELVFKKESIIFFSESAFISYEYGFAAYVGQKISEICTLLQYSGPPLDKQGYFSFSFISKDKTNLAEYLTFISGIFGNEEHSESLDVNSEFEDLVSNLSIESAVCPDFLENYLNYRNEGEDQLDED